MQPPFFVLLDDAVAGQGTLYEHLVHINTIKANALDTLHELLQENWQKQWHSVIWAPYGLGSNIMGLSALSSQAANDKQQQDDELRIFWFSKKTSLNNNIAIQTWLQEQYAPEEPAGLMQLALTQDKNSYIKTIEQVREDIAAGEIYQINYTTQLQFQAYGSAFRLYQKIRAKQPVPYGVLACLPPGKSIQNQLHSQGHNWTLCFSPELFLDIRQDGSIHTEPMKGTVPAFNDGQNEHRAETLRADPKNRAENIMIVDLLRNDLSKIAVPNGVRVDELFKVAQFGPVLQMTTPIHAQARPDTKAGDVFNALFPCGSITGAPKKRSMQLIEQYETRARGLYTGSIGFLAPCQSGLGFYGKLNVVIRTLELTASVTPPPDGKPSQYTQQ
ncbi:MAG: bifunctional aminodeoxychorismate synthase component I/aminodeoxychorismate lyase, partial [Alcaligenaceae bacterium]|nr:bifunctional aminodeoxychorismate synthase component I/aminodeoxychorismate lyase [Alcaligenaceae bacterium]